MTLNNLASHIILVCIFCVFQSILTAGQQSQYDRTQQACISDAEYEEVFALCDANAKTYGLDKQLKSAAPVLLWPLKLAPGFDYPSYYTIYNYVDLDPTTGAIQDYTCNSRTYDGHRGIDIDLDPFEWQMMDENAVQVIAAAPGTIVFKDDGHFDQNCSCTGTPNRIIVEHADGSRTMYWHLKRNTLTSKVVGDDVNTGEYLGLVGSSGCSTWPHLHFEVRDPNNAVVEPFSGSCNPIGSLWANQRPYYDSGINRVATYSSIPMHGLPNCPSGHSVDQQDYFYGSLSDNITIEFNLRHTLSSQSVTVAVENPLGNLVMWNEVIFLNTTIKSSHTKSFILNSSYVNGKYTVTVSYLGQSATHDFWITDQCVTNRVINNQVHTFDKWHNASQTIVSNSDSNAGVETLYNANVKITLTPGFRAQHGFHAYLGNACPN